MTVDGAAPPLTWRSNVQRSAILQYLASRYSFATFKVYCHNMHIKMTAFI